MINFISNCAIPIIILLIIVYGLIEKNKVYDTFLDGAKEEKQNQIKEQITTLFSQYDLKVLDVDPKVNKKSAFQNFAWSYFLASAWSS